MSIDPGDAPVRTENAPPENHWSLATTWSMVASGVIIAMWIMLVVLNRRSSGEVSPEGGLADLLEITSWVWAAIGAIAFALAVVGLVRSRPKGGAVLALIFAIVLEAAGFISRIW